MTTKSQITSN